MKRRHFLDVASKLVLGSALLPDISLCADTAKIFSNSKPDILLIAGGGFDKLSISAMEASFMDAGAHATLVGNGEDLLSLEQISAALKDAAATKRHITIFIMEHGKNKSGTLWMGKYENNLLPAASVFNEIKRWFDSQPVDIVIGSCFGGSAIPETNLLPMGSRVFALAPIESGIDIDRLYAVAANLGHTPLDGEGLFYHYLCNVLEDHLTPMVAIAGQGYYDLEKVFDTHCGIAFSAKEKMVIHNKLDPIVGPGKVDVVLGMMAHAEYKFGQDASDDLLVQSGNYGLALAAVYAAGPPAEPLLKAYNLGGNGPVTLPRYWSLTPG